MEEREKIEGCKAKLISLFFKNMWLGTFLFKANKQYLVFSTFFKY